MENKFRVKVNQSYDYTIDSKQVNDLDILEGISDNYHIIYKNKSLKTKLVHRDFNKKKYTITLNSNTYEIDISGSLDMLIKEMGYTSGSSKKLNFINSPMPGIIIDLPIKIGDKVKEGDTLLILEAMKMENAIVSPKNALVKSIFISIGEAVDKGKLLIELE